MKTKTKTKITQRGPFVEIQFEDCYGVIRQRTYHAPFDGRLGYVEDDSGNRPCEMLSPTGTALMATRRTLKAVIWREYCQMRAVERREANRMRAAKRREYYRMRAAERREAKSFER